MGSDDFVAYVGDPDIHDAVVESVSYTGNQAEVVLATPNGRRLKISFNDVKLFHAHQPLGMVVDALNEMLGLPPYRKFVFTNSDEANDSFLSLEARDFNCN